MFIVSSRVSWVIIGVSEKMVVGTSTFSTPGGHRTGKIGVPEVGMEQDEVLPRTR